MYDGAGSPQHRSSGSEELDLGLEPMSPLSSTSSMAHDSLSTPRDPTSNGSTTDDMMFYTASAASVSAVRHTHNPLCPIPPFHPTHPTPL